MTITETIQAEIARLNQVLAILTPPKYEPALFPGLTPRRRGRPPGKKHVADAVISKVHKKRVISEATKAKMRKAAKARWAVKRKHTKKA